MGCEDALAEWGITNTADYVRVADVWPLNPEGELFAMAKIESPEGVKNINEILDVPGLSGVIVGPGDLAMNSGTKSRRTRNLVTLANRDRPVCRHYGRTTFRRRSPDRPARLGEGFALARPA